MSGESGSFIYWLHIGFYSLAINAFSLISGLVPLHNACSYGHYEVAELLVRHGASVNVADLWKFTPLHEAAAKGKYEICKLLLKVCAGVLRYVFKCIYIYFFWRWISAKLIALSEFFVVSLNQFSSCNCQLVSCVLSLTLKESSGQVQFPACVLILLAK